MDFKICRSSDSSAPISDAAGKMLGVVLVFRDVTARRIAERELEHWKQIFSGAGFGMFVARPADWRHRRYESDFRRRNAHGYSVNELLGTPLQALVPRNSYDNFASALRIAGGHGPSTCSKVSICAAMEPNFPAWSM